MTDWFIKYPKIKRLGHEETKGIWDGKVIVEEKIDGANFRFAYDPISGRAIWGTRNVSYATVPEERWPKRFEKQWRWVLEHRDSLRPGYIYFAEAVIPHTIQYDWNRFPAPLIGFDVWDIKEERFVPYPKNKEMFEGIGLPFVPVVEVLNGKPSVEEFEKLVPKSQFYDGTAEGVVLKNYDNGIFAKILSEKFIEANRLVFGKSKKEIKDETEKWFEYLFSPRRIEKTIERLVDEGHKLSMAIMRDLIYEVMKDAMEEEGFEFISKASAVDVRRMRKLLSRRCQNILQRYIAMESLK